MPNFFFDCTKGCGNRIQVTLAGPGDPLAPKTCPNCGGPGVLLDQGTDTADTEGFNPDGTNNPAVKNDAVAEETQPWQTEFQGEPPV